jgi:tetratricopeptide (TPR) repeat protein
MASSLRIEELKKKFDENPRRYFAPLANEYRKAGDVAEAIRICRAHLPQQPGHMSGHIVFGQALYESGELDESRQVFEAALALDPENLIALRHLGDIARVHGDPVAARRWYERVLDADPRNDEISGLIAALPGADAAPRADTDGASGWGDVNPEAPASMDRRETPTFTNAAALLDLDEPPTAGDVEPLAGFEATSADEGPRKEAGTPATADAEPLADFPELDLPASPPPSVTESPTVAFQAIRPPTPDGFPSIEVEEADTSIERTAGGADFDLDAFEAQTQYASAGATGDAASDAPAAKAPSGDGPDEAEFGDFPELDREGRDAAAPAEPPRAEPTPPVERQPQRWDRTPLSMEAIAAGEPTAEAHAASPADYGFETMEFVPPVRDANARSEFDVEVRDIDPDDATPAAFVTETMAELYLQQGFREEALNVYRQLLAQNPNDPGLRERVYQLEHGARSSISMAAMVEKTPASTSTVAPADAGAPSARAFFATLASRRAPDWYQPAAYAPGDEPEAAGAAGVATSDAGGAAAGWDTEPDAGALSEADALEPAALDYMAEVSRTPAEALPTIAEVAALDVTEAPVAAGRAPSLTPGGSVDSLFGGASVSREDEQAAQALAGVFTTGEMSAVQAPVQGRPTRAASTEISLDHVFRDESQKAAPRRSAGFSFDQFFSEAAGGSAPETTAPQPGPGTPGESTGDIEQFNAWLEGLKKK